VTGKHLRKKGSEMPAVEEIVETEQERVERWRADESYLPGFRVGDEEPVGAFTVRGSPESVAGIQSDAVLGILHARRHRQFLGIMRDQRIHILSDEAFQARAIARGLGPAGQLKEECDRSGHPHTISAP
jgi:hypothetical protein